MQHYSIQSFGVQLKIPNLRPLPRRRHSRDIIASVAKAFKVAEEDLTGPRHYRALAWPRQAAYLILREERKLSYGQIAQIFNRDHSTIVYGCRAAKQRKAYDADFAARYEAAAS